MKSLHGDIKADPPLQAITIFSVDKETNHGNHNGTRDG